jgi:hypothetical protein
MIENTQMTLQLLSFFVCVLLASLTLVFLDRFLQEKNRPPRPPYQVDKAHIVTVYCQGNGASRVQAAKYTGLQGVRIRIPKVEQEDHVYIPSLSTQLLYNVHVYDDLSDIAYGYSLNPFHWLSKLFHYGVTRYFNMHGVNHIPHNYITHSNVGGFHDVKDYLMGVSSCIQSSHPTSKIVLFGTSRGASTVISSLTSLTVSERQRIALVIVEAPFDNVPSIVRTRFGPNIGSFLLNVLEKFGRYKPGQFSPLQAVLHPDFPLEIPIAFVTSKVDSIVPCEHTMVLHDALQKRNHSHLYHLELEHSSHNGMSLDNPSDIKAYGHFVHDLYEKYCSQ